MNERVQTYYTFSTGDPVEAIQLTEENAELVEQWCGSSDVVAGMRINDYLLKTAASEFQIVRPSLFTSVYYLP